MYKCFGKLQSGLYMQGKISSYLHSVVLLYFPQTMAPEKGSKLSYETLTFVRRVLQPHNHFVEVNFIFLFANEERRLITWES